MAATIGFSNLKIGQRVKVKGKPANDGGFEAMEVEIKPPDEAAALEGKIQNLDAQKSVLRLMNRDFVVSGGVEIKNAQRQSINLATLRVGDIVKLKGTYSAANGFMPAKVKMQEPKGFGIEELQGNIDKIDADRKTLDILGFSVVATDKTEIVRF